MKEYLERIPEELKNLIANAGEIASAQNTPIYLVGGFVRDLLLGVKNLDLDIVVEGNAIECARRFACALRARVISHSRFGTATVVISRHSKVDFATARKEHYPEPASLPVVAPSTLRDDLARRDFTINAMAISIGAANFGHLIDYFKGRDDLRRHKVRVLHPLSFIDDPTRILRAIRFEKRYNFAIDKETLKYLRGAVSLHMLEKVQPQRMRNELVLLLKEKKPLRALLRLHSLAGLRFIDKKLVVSQKMLRVCKAVECQIQWFERTHAGRRPLDTWVLYFMGLLDTLSVADTESLCARYMFLKCVQKRILGVKAIKPGLVASLSKKRIVPSQVYALLEPFSYEEILVLKAKYPNASLQQHVGDFLTRYNGARLYIGGQDLIHLGLTPGPHYQKIFKTILDAKLNGAVRTKAEEVRFARKLLSAR